MALMIDALLRWVEKEDETVTYACCAVQALCKYKCFLKETGNEMSTLLGVCEEFLPS